MVSCTSVYLAYRIDGKRIYTCICGTCINTCYDSYVLYRKRYENDGRENNTSGNRRCFKCNKRGNMLHSNRNNNRKRNTYRIGTEYGIFHIVFRKFREHIYNGNICNDNVDNFRNGSTGGSSICNCTNGSRTRTYKIRYNTGIRTYVLPYICVSFKYYTAGSDKQLYSIRNSKFGSNENGIDFSKTRIDRIYNTVFLSCKSATSYKRYKHTYNNCDIYRNNRNCTFYIINRRIHALQHENI